jgi:hypothetical protein
MLHWRETTRVAHLTSRNIHRHARRHGKRVIFEGETLITNEAESNRIDGCRGLSLRNQILSLLDVTNKDAFEGETLITNEAESNRIDGCRGLSLRNQILSLLDVTNKDAFEEIMEY